MPAKAPTKGAREARRKRPGVATTAPDNFRMPWPGTHVSPRLRPKVRWLCDGKSSYHVLNLLRHMDRLKPEALDVIETIQSSGWGVDALKHCLMSLEGAGIVRFLGGDRWELVGEHTDAKTAVEAAGAPVSMLIGSASDSKRCCQRRRQRRRRRWRRHS